MEKVIKPVNGYLALVVSIIALGISIFGFTQAANPALLWLAVPCLLVTIFIWKGLMIIQPNHARVLNLFGKYSGSVKANGLFFVNPFYSTVKITQRAQNLGIPTLKVNDKMGNPIEIGAVVVWQVQDTYRAA